MGLGFINFGGPKEPQSDATGKEGDGVERRT